MAKLPGSPALNQTRLASGKAPRVRLTEGWYERSASAAIFSPKGPWRLSSSSALHRAFTNKRFKGHGLFSMETMAGA